MEINRKTRVGTSSGALPSALSPRPSGFLAPGPRPCVLDISEVDFEFDVQLDIDLGLTWLVLT